jgi:NitT/TauT family transport system permease protein
MILAQAVVLLATLPPSAWGEIAVAALATAVRVALALVIALAWTVPCGIALGLRPHLSAAVQPVLQIIASVPATALFPVILLAFLKLPGGLDVAAVFLMLLGTQWYILFNVIAGASAIPSPLRQITATLHIRGWERWRALYVPAIFPALVTGMITASGGSWNASIVAEEVKFGGERYGTIGLGGTIARATAAGDYALLLAATLTMITLVVLINRLVWRRLYAVAAERYRLD